MSVDWESEVGAPLVETFGGGATYFPADGSPSFPVNGVFDEGYREVTIIDGLAYTSEAQPVIGINESQFVANGRKAAQGDKVQITDPKSKAFGKVFIVKEPRPDSHGIVKLMMNETSDGLPCL
jgi:hypothetical protein